MKPLQTRLNRIKPDGTKAGNRIEVFKTQTLIKKPLGGDSFVQNFLESHLFWPSHDQRGIEVSRKSETCSELVLQPGSSFFLSTLNYNFLPLEERDTASSYRNYQVTTAQGCHILASILSWQQAIKYIPGLFGYWIFVWYQHSPDAFTHS